MEYFLQSLLFSLITSIIFYFISKTKNGEFAFTGDFILSYSKNIKAIVFVVVLLNFIVFAFVWFKIKPKTFEENIPFIILMFLTFSIFVYSWARLSREKYIINSVGITALYPFRQHKIFLFQDVDEIKYNVQWQCLILKKHDGSKMRINQYLSGFEFLVDLVNKVYSTNIRLGK